MNYWRKKSFILQATGAFLCECKNIFLAAIFFFSVFFSETNDNVDR
jgi:hypothetical protein